MRSFLEVAFESCPILKVIFFIKIVVFELSFKERSHKGVEDKKSSRYYWSQPDCRCKKGPGRMSNSLLQAWASGCIPFV